MAFMLFMVNDPGQVAYFNERRRRRKGSARDMFGLEPSAQVYTPQVSKFTQRELQDIPTDLKTFGVYVGVYTAYQSPTPFARFMFTAVIPGSHLWS
jgi:hypothetical protein